MKTIYYAALLITSCFSLAPAGQAQTAPTQQGRASYQKDVDPKKGSTERDKAARAATGDTIIFLTRHAERTMNDSDPLLPAGIERAKRLATMLSGSKVTGIYSSNAPRTIKTADPLALRLGLTVQKVDQGDPTAVAAAVLRDNAGGRALIVGHSDTVPKIIHALGVTETVDVVDEYDNFYVVIVGPNGQAPALIRMKY